MYNKDKPNKWGVKIAPVMKLKKGDIKACRKDDKFSVLNDVTMLSTLYDASTETVRRVKKGNVIETVTKPTVVCMYNEYMGGECRFNQQVSSYALIRKSIKWW